MASQAIEIQHHRPLTAVEFKANIQLIQEVMKAIMKEDTHYGTIPGCKKPSLYKPGSEVLLSTFKIAIEPITEDLSTHDVARYRVVARATSMATGSFLGSGIGEASSDEEKHKWREAVCTEEFEATPEDRRRTKWKKGSGQNSRAYTVLQVRTEPADLANTVLKMAKKRAQIDVTLTVLAASDIFTQDLEDLPEGTTIDDSDAQNQDKGAPAATGSQPVQMPQRKTATASGAAAPATTTGPSKPAPQQHQEAPTQSAHTPQGEKISDGQDKRFFAICMGNGHTKNEMKEYLRKTWKIESSRDIIKGEMYDACIAWAEGR